MDAFKFTSELTECSVVNIPNNLVSKMSKSNSVQAIALIDETEDKEWQLGAYEQFLREDSDDDAIYDHCLNNML